jgi:phage terminase large subunit
MKCKNGFQGEASFWRWTLDKILCFSNTMTIHQWNKKEWVKQANVPTSNYVYLTVFTFEYKNFLFGDELEAVQSREGPTNP